MARTNNDNKSKADTKSNTSGSGAKGKSENAKNKKRSGGDDHHDDDEDEEDIIDELEYKKFLSKLFPSKHMKENVEKGERLKRIIKEDMQEQDEEEEGSSSSHSGSNEEVELEITPVKKSKKNTIISKSNADKFIDVMCSSKSWFL